MTRISPEAPVPVVRFQSEHVRLGGAANVAHNLAALGAHGVARRRRRRGRAPPSGCATQLADGRHRRATAWSRIAAGRRSRRCASSPSATSRSRASTTRTTPTSSGDVERRLRRSDRRGSARRRKVLLVSDYLKGTVTRGVMRALAGAEARAARRCSSTRRFRTSTATPGATLVTPNHHEAEAATHRRIRTDEDARGGRVEFRARARCDARADHARRTRHVAVEPRGRRARSRPSRAKCPTSPAPATRSSRRSRSRWPPGPRSRKRRSSRTTPPASSSASSARPRVDAPQELASGRLSRIETSAESANRESASRRKFANRLNPARIRRFEQPSLSAGSAAGR